MNQPDRRQFLAAMAAGFAAPALGMEDAPAMQRTTRNAVRRGLQFLARRQNDDGSMGSGRYADNAAVVGLAGLAFMAAGSTPGRGPHGKAVNRCINFLLRRTSSSGFISSPGHGPMYGHGFATMFLAEAYGMSPESEIRETLLRAVQVIVAAQNADGGWRYEPRTEEADISVSICQIMALRAARNAGIYVPNQTIDRCVDYVKRCQNPDGGFMYMLSHPGESRFPRSAAGLVALYSAGVYEGPEIESGLRYLRKYPPSAELRTQEDYYIYGQYYAVQAMWHAGGEHWRQWYPAVHGELLQQQAGSGAWEGEISPEYQTAMACIILQMPNNYLPIFQR